VSRFHPLTQRGCYGEESEEEDGEEGQEVESQEEEVVCKARAEPRAPPGQPGGRTYRIKNGGPWARFFDVRILRRRPAPVLDLIGDDRAIQYTLLWIPGAPRSRGMTIEIKLRR
jgi:hypothetical protein